MEFDALQIGIGLIFGAIVAFFAKEAYLERKIKRLSEENEDMNEEIISLRNTLAGRAGLDARKEKSERMQQMMLEFAAAMKEPNADIKAIMPIMAQKYPDIAMDLVKKGLKMI